MHLPKINSSELIFTHSPPLSSELIDVIARSNRFTQNAVDDSSVVGVGTFRVGVYTLRAIPGIRGNFIRPYFNLRFSGGQDARLKLHSHVN